MNEDVMEFLKELTELTKKYNVYIGGCGCCGSPFLFRDGSDPNDGSIFLGKDLGFDDETGYEIEWDARNKKMAGIKNE